MKGKLKTVWVWFEDHMTPCIVVFSFSIVLVFTALTQFMEWHNISVDSTLIEYFYKFFGFELIALSGIKVSKHLGSAFGKAEDAIDGELDFTEDTEEDSENGQV